MYQRASQRMMGPCLGRPSTDPRNEGKREGTDKYPGLSNANCEVVAVHYRQWGNEGHRQLYLLHGGTKRVLRYVCWTRLLPRLI